MAMEEQLTFKLLWNTDSQKLFDLIREELHERLCGLYLAVSLVPVKTFSY
jgi:hypothetical protein